MDKQQIVYNKVTECIRTIFAFSLSRTPSREEAEDLSQEIVKEVLRSANSLRDEQAFYGWMWGIANNVYKCYLRKHRKIEQCDIDENLPDTVCEMPETVVVQNEEINTLRRELSLLSEDYRKVSIMYYIHDCSCKDISQKLNLSLEMVKYLLFKSRKILREGMNMSREYGEKSYNPGVFNIDVWMDEDDYMLYYDLFDRKLPGNILLAAYYNPMTVGELSVELGVSAPYLEDEIKILMKHNLIKQLHNARYQTNIIIFTKGCEDDIYGKTSNIFAQASEELFEFINKSEERIRKINFIGSDYSKNRIYWLATNTVLLNALSRSQEEMKEVEEFPTLSNGTHGYIWAYNSDKESDFFNGIYGDCDVEPDGDYVNVCNFKIIEKCQEFHPRDPKIDILLKVARHEVIDDNNEILAQLISEGYIRNDNKKYSLNFPVFTEKQYNQFVNVMECIIEKMKDCIKLGVSEAQKVVQNHAQAQMAASCSAVAEIKCRNNCIGYIVKEMCDKGYLSVPDSPEKLAMYAVLK